MGVCREFPLELENNQLSDCSIIFLVSMSDGNCDELFEDL